MNIYIYIYMIYHDISYMEDLLWGVFSSRHGPTWSPGAARGVMLCLN